MMHGQKNIKLQEFFQHYSRLKPQFDEYFLIMYVKTCKTFPLKLVWTAPSLFYLYNASSSEKLCAGFLVETAQV